MSERREHPRVKGPFEGYWDGAGRQDGRIVDLSVSGCFIESVALPRVGQTVTVSIAGVARAVGCAMFEGRRASGAGWRRLVAQH